MDFLADNQLYQSLKESGIECQETQGNLESNILSQIGEENVRLYRHFNRISEIPVLESQLDGYLQFLDLFD